MESLVELFFREAYELDEIPGPQGGFPRQISPSELLSISSPSVEFTHERGNDSERVDRSICFCLQGSPCYCSSGFLEVTGPPQSPAAEPSHVPDLGVTWASQNHITSGSDSPDRGMRWVASEYSR